MSETFNASDRKSIRQREKEAKRWALSRAEVVVEMMSTENGRRWMWEMLELAHVFSVNPDQSTVMFTEGQRSIGNTLMKEVIDACPEQFIQAMRESNARSSRPESASSSDSDSTTEWDADSRTDDFE